MRVAGAKARAAGEAALVARLIHDFLGTHAPTVITDSPNTLRSYRDALSLYLSYLESRGVTPGSLSRDHFGREWLEGFVAWLKEVRGNSNGTCNVRLSCLRTFLEYAGGREPGMLGPHVEAGLIRRQSSEGRKVSGMSREAVRAMLAAPDTSNARGRRDVAFLTLMYSTAARLDEVRTLTAGRVALDADTPHVTVRGKGGRMRTCYLLPKTAALLRAYASEALGDDPDPGSLLFESPVKPGCPLSERAWDKRIKAIAAIAHETCADVPLDAHCHQLRHSKASHWVEDKVSVAEVQRLLGHRQLATTMRYIDSLVPREAEALATIEGETGAEKRWRREDGSLKGFCGLGGAR